MNWHHNVYVQNGKVHLANDCDDFYVQEFGSWDEVNAFIEKLKSAADEAFGVDYSNPVYDK